MYRHRPFAGRCPFQAYAVVKVFSENLQHLEVVLRQFLSGLFLLSGGPFQTFDLFFELSYRQVVLYDEVAELLLSVPG